MSETHELEGLVALVTGSSRGIGRATALELARQGADVILHYHQAQEAAEEVASLIRSRYQRRTFIVQADLGTVEGCQHVVQQALEAFDHVDIFVANAGYSSHVDFERLSPEEWNRSLAVNLSHAFFIAQGLAPPMKERKFGRLIFISSLRARSGSPHGPHYAAAKAGLLGLAKSLALILGPYGITVNTIVPGYTLTDMTRRAIEEKREAILSRIPVRKIAMPEEIARAVAFLASPASGSINSAILDINGGIYFPS